MWITYYTYSKPQINFLKGYMVASKISLYPLISPHIKEIGESVVLIFFTGNAGTPHSELSKNGEDNNLWYAQGTLVDILNSRYANL
jgi:hypothetical protein